MQCGTQVPEGSVSCPSCGRAIPNGRSGAGTASAPVPAPAPAATVSKTSANKAIWIVGAIAVILAIGYFAATATGGKLTTQRAQQALSQWSGGGIMVTGVQEIPQQNAASAALSFSSFNVRQQGFFGQTSTRAYTGPGEATFTHYTDGRWVLVKVTTSEGFNSVWWDNLNIQVR